MDGEVPARKWSTFYMKVIARLAAIPDLNLRVSIEAPTDEAQAASKIEEVKSALRELDSMRTSFLIFFQ